MSDRRRQIDHEAEKEEDCLLFADIGCSTVNDLWSKYGTQISALARLDDQDETPDCHTEASTCPIQQAAGEVDAAMSDGVRETDSAWQSMGQRGDSKFSSESFRPVRSRHRSSRSAPYVRDDVVGSEKRMEPQELTLLMSLKFGM
eukprot:TRINITY_DN65793_c0_g1_i1.p1 TRINITY_DN65793_c0_g1~~TRINITY_DN65793_c0_g1_i1.p1  ORF type:complete len:162 (-),score=20.37 TRINITY_DN65793_c0_g1_i1:288-722(-)